MLFRKQQKGLLDKIKEQNAGVTSDLNVEQQVEQDMVTQIISFRGIETLRTTIM